MRRDDVIARRAGALLEALDGRSFVGYTDARHSLVNPDPTWWLTGLRAAGPAVVRVDGHGTVELLVSPVDRWRAKEHAVAGSTRVADGHPLGSLGKGEGGSPLLFAGANRLTRATRRHLGAGIESIDAVFHEVARTADEVHLAAFDAATTIAEQAYSELFGMLRPGVPEHVVVADFDARLRELGSEDNFLFMSASLHNRAVHRPTARRLEPGDVLLAEISPSVDGVYTQICRTVVLGEPTAQLEREYALMEAAFSAGLQACTPGNEARQITLELNEVMAAAGYAQYCRPPYMRVRGHGLGLGSDLPGDLHVDNTVVLKEGDTFVLHPNQYLPSVGYLLCGDPLLVTADGHRLLTHRPAGLGVVPC